MELAHMYKSFFNFNIKPFDLLPDPRFLYLSKSHKKALTYLDYGIRERSGFVLLTGEVGSGKTTLIRDLLDKCYEHVVVSKIFNTRVTSEQLLAMINEDFGLTVQGKDKVTLIRDLNAFLIEQYSCGNQPILIIDEAQNLSPELLEEVRMISNLEASTSKLLQIILVGQPELRTILASPELRQLRQRININCHLQALNRVEVEHYIDRRLEVAGNASAVQFSPESLDAVFCYSRGIPRLINIICDFLLLSAFAEETTLITVEMIQEVIGDLDFENYYWTSAIDEKKNEQDNSSATVTDKQLSKQELQLTLADISRRIDAIGHNMESQLHTTAKGQNERFAAFQSSVTLHIAKADSNFLYLNRKLEELRGRANNNEQITTREKNKVGFIQRFSVFGDAPVTHPK
jgi:putative secretion ATPase (PEP-CTERM system associated)